MKLTILKEYDLRIPLGQVRSCEVDLGYEKGMLFAYSTSGNVDPCERLLTYWEHPVHLAMYSENGNQMWHRELGIGLVPGVWFMPFIAFDLDGDGVDEIWFVNNPTKTPFDSNRMVMERLDSRTGKTIGTYPFPAWNIMGSFLKFLTFCPPERSLPGRSHHRPYPGGPGRPASAPDQIRDGGCPQ